MAIVIDADVIIRGEKGVFDVEAWAARFPDEHFELAAITVAELWHGVERADPGHRGRRQRYIERILDKLPTIPHTERTARELARIWALLQASGSMIGAYDLIVAATALVRGSQVATFNRRHFACIPGLKVIEPE